VASIFEAAIGVAAAIICFSRRQIDNTLSLAFLGPELVQAIIDGRLPRGTTVSRLINPPWPGRRSGRCWG
jgi:hypothetical protein